MKPKETAQLNTHDWNEVEALRASLREHMAEIHRLRAAGRQALDALEAALSDDKPYIERCKQSSNVLRATLSWDAMQRLTDVQQEMKAVTDCKEGDKLASPLDVPETNFGNMAQVVDSTRADHIADANKMVEPVAYVTGYYEGRCVIKSVEPVLLPAGMALYRSPANQSEDTLGMVKPVAYIHESGFLVRTPGAALTAGTKLYTAPPKREPLTEEEIIECVAEVDEARLAGPITALIRAVERKLGIGGEE